MESGPSLKRRSITERSDLKPYFAANTCQYGFSVCRIEGRFGWMMPRRSLMPGAVSPGRSYSVEKSMSAEMPIFPRK